MPSSETNLCYMAYESADKQYEFDIEADYARPQSLIRLYDGQRKYASSVLVGMQWACGWGLPLFAVRYGKQQRKE